MLVCFGWAKVGGCRVVWGIIEVGGILRFGVDAEEKDGLISNAL